MRLKAQIVAAQIEDRLTLKRHLKLSKTIFGENFKIVLTMPCKFANI